MQQVAPPLSLVVGPLLAVGLLTVFSWRLTLVWLGVFVAVVGVAFLIFGRFAAFPSEPPSVSLIKPVVRLRSLWVMVFLFALGMGAQVGSLQCFLCISRSNGDSVPPPPTPSWASQHLPIGHGLLLGWITDRIGENGYFRLSCADWGGNDHARSFSGTGSE